MKKILLVAMVAMAFMACNSNGADMPKGEKKAVNAATVEGVALLGEDASTVEAKLVKAGYVRLDNEIPWTPVGAPAKKMAQKIKQGSSYDEQMYAYNLPDNYDEMTEQESIAYMNKLLADGKSFIMVIAWFDDDELESLTTAVVTGIREKVNLVYTDMSDDMYDVLPASPKGVWEGYMGQADSKEEPEVYADHSKFVSAIKDAEEIMAEEMGVSMTEFFTYGGMWMYPNAEQRKEQKETGMNPFCMGTIVITAGGLE